MKILITGASGFIGTNLLQYYLEKGFIVKNYDIEKPRNKIHDSFWEKVDIRDLGSLRDALMRFLPDYIIHLAARTDLEGKSLDDYSANIIGVENLMKTLPSLPNLKKIIITSSMLVCHTGYYPKNQFDYAPSTLYGESKVKTEESVWNNKPQCDWAIIRPTSIWGQWFGVPYRNFFDIIRSRLYFHIGHKSCTKTYGYVGNSIYQIEQLLLNDTIDTENKVFYIGDNPPIYIENWANEIADQLKISIPRIPYWVIRCAGLFGDLITKLGFHFPMTSFRLKNMTTDNIIDLTNTYQVAPHLPYSRMDGIKETLKWIHSQDN